MHVSAEPEYQQACEGSATSASTNRNVEASEVADAALFLIGPGSRAVTEKSSWWTLAITSADSKET